MGKKNKLKDIDELEYPIDCYDNRELSWLKFNKRVLEEAQDPANPLCEQLNFINIFQSNLDEFFMVRIGTLYDERKSDVRDNKSHMTAKEQLNAVLAQVRKMLKAKDKCYNELAAKLKLSGVEIVGYEQLSGKEKRQAGRYFINQVLPLLSPQVIAEKQPFPFLAGEEIYAVALLENKTAGEKKKTRPAAIGIIPCSGSRLKRLVPLAGGKRHILVEEMIRAFVPIIFAQYRIIGSSLIRLVRNADVSIDDDQQDDFDNKSKDYRKAVERMIDARKRMGAIKLEYTGKINANLISVVCDYLNLPKKHAFYSGAPLDLSFLYTVSDSLAGKKELFYQPRQPQLTPEALESESMISQIEKKDVLLSYPYESMRPFLRLLNEAANDPDVTSIRITLYRLAKTSQIVSALAQAAENGKDVLALVELRARFDEANNMDQSAELENSGCRVIYGLEKYKVHSKMCLITRKTANGKEFITQIGTGNYNEKTARLYTDYSLLTANYAIGEEAEKVFEALVEGETVENTDTLLVAPNSLKNKVTEKLDRQIALAKEGKPAYAGFKLNSLTDKDLIDKLIEASAAGVKIQMLIRGICCLVTGVPGLTDNIEVYSIVGRYLEHGRIYIFGCDGEEEVYIASADLMTRNTERRVEVAAPILDADLRTEMLESFRKFLSDNCKLRVMLDDGSYVRVQAEGERFNAQEYFAENSYRLAGVPLPEEAAAPESEAPAGEPAAEALIAACDEPETADEAGDETPDEAEEPIGDRSEITDEAAEILEEIPEMIDVLPEIFDVPELFDDAPAAEEEPVSRAMPEEPAEEPAEAPAEEPAEATAEEPAEEPAEAPAEEAAPDENFEPVVLAADSDPSLALTTVTGTAGKTGNGFLEKIFGLIKRIK